MHAPRVIIMGAGPAGLTAAYLLSKAQIATEVLERDDVVGGISRTATHGGYRFDIGGHRFFTKVSIVEDLWNEILGDDLILRRRLSRIYYRGKFFSYPLKPFNALSGLGLWETSRCVGSYVQARLRPITPEDNFEAWICNRFGRRLFEIFFRTYTEKVWGMPCSEIEAEWAAQRIKGLSLGSAIKNALFGETASSKQGVVKTLIDQFQYPRLGPGMMWERARELSEARGAKVHLHTPVRRIHWDADGVTSIESDSAVFQGTHSISSIAMDELVEALTPAPPAEVLAAAKRLRYRDFLTVALVIDRPDLFPDNWVYVHDPTVKLGRIQNFGNWSPEMVPDATKSCLGLEYFCHEGDDLWSMPDEDLLALGAKEIVSLGLLGGAKVVDGAVVRMPKAYPVYDSGYSTAVDTIREFITRRLPNLQLVGRNGMHRYNNQDHSMLTAMLAVKNITGSRYDLWRVNVDEEYQEEGPNITEEDLLHLELGQPLVPRGKGK
ncbi:MAG: NAD(P)/FAD-dependent oxidoreductase [Acidobacteria bacterium]|nr:NAD(P)/FAD-dependent oxidoreductase [Acidobacteriota bacterium]MDA1234890.1 NAD(P)/FAD-dependent oxidoreductase [Acidobacteriota bacterium]